MINFLAPLSFSTSFLTFYLSFLQMLSLHPKLSPYMVAIVMSHPPDDLQIVADFLVKEFRQVGLMTLNYKHPTTDLETQINK
jgi:hypothetical protein